MIIRRFFMAGNNRSDDFDAFLASLDTEPTKKPDDIDLKVTDAFDVNM